LFTFTILGNQRRDGFVWQLMKPSPCCRKNCVREGRNDKKQLPFIRMCVDEYIDMKRDMKSNYMMYKAKSFILNSEVNDKNLKYCWTLGVAPNIVLRYVCPRAFQLVYSISHGSVENICRKFKKGTVLNDRPFNDLASFPTTSKNISLMELNCENFGFKLKRNAKQVLLYNSLYFFLILNTFHYS